MSWVTYVLAASEIETLRARLESDGFELKPLAHGHFRARGAGLVINAYRSGKVVVQGAGAAEAPPRWLEGLGEPAGKAAAGGLPDLPLIGTDEAGKGDYFGPLAVAGVAAEADEAAVLERLGVRDCKGLADGAVHRIDEVIRARFPHALEVLEPESYNRAHRRLGNVNLILAEAHAAVIARLCARVPSIERVLVDRFASERLVEAALARRKVAVELVQLPRAEGNLAVAAASIVARAAFLRSLEDLGRSVGETLPKGGSNAAVLAAGAWILESEGRAGLGRVAKLHFKTTGKLRPRF